MPPNRWPVLIHSDLSAVIRFGAISHQGVSHENAVFVQPQNVFSSSHRHPGQPQQAPGAFGLGHARQLGSSDPRDDVDRVSRRVLI